MEERESARMDAFRVAVSAVWFRYCFNVSEGIVYLASMSDSEVLFILSKKQENTSSNEMCTRSGFCMSVCLVAVGVADSRSSEAG